MPDYPTRLGHYETTAVGGERVRAYVPIPLPPVPAVDLTGLQAALELANQTVGRLDGIASVLPDPSLFLYMYIRKEALLSSQIEGTQSSLSDLLLFEAAEAPGVPIDDTREVSNYVAAMNHGLQRLREDFPLSLRLIREIHAILLSNGRGQDKDPGEFRRSQNWIGGTRPGNAAFVPPPAEVLMECMSRLELFLHDQPEPTPVLLKAALAHVQFETIHPFLDGNGRLGRLLITLLLCEQQVLKEPMLYLSLYFKTHRQYYYELLGNVRLTGDWEAWLDFFADAIIVTATQAVETAQQLLELSKRNGEKIRGLGRAATSTLQIHRVLMENPITTSGRLVEKTGISPATVNKALVHLEQLGIVRELTAQKRNRLFSYTEYVEIMSRGTEL